MGRKTQLLLFLNMEGAADADSMTLVWLYSVFIPGSGQHIIKKKNAIEIFLKENAITRGEAFPDKTSSDDFYFFSVRA